MKFFKQQSIAFAIFFIVLKTNAYSQDFVSNKIYIKFKDKKTLENIDYRNQAKSFKFKRNKIEQIFIEQKVKSVKPAFKLKNKELDKIFEIIFDDTSNVNLFLNKLNKLSDVKFAERIPIYRTNLVPNDIHPNQWGLLKIQAPQAWDISTGSATIKVAVVDDAVKLNHQDLQNNIWTRQ